MTIPTPSSRPDRSHGPEPDADDPRQALRVAIERMYTAFERIPFDATMFRLGASVSDEDLEGLGRPIRDIPAPLVARFLMKAGTTWGGPGDMRRITPRALDLASRDRLGVDRQLLWTKVRWARWPDWPTYQVLTVRSFLDAEWRRVLCTDPAPGMIAHRWLRDDIGGVDSLVPFLAVWHEVLAEPTPLPRRTAATGHLVLLLCHSPVRAGTAAGLSRLFPRHREAAIELARWLLGSTTARLLTENSALLPDEGDRRRAEQAKEQLATLARAVGAG